MRMMTLALGAAAALVAGAALAHSGPHTTSICLDVSGRTLPVTCKMQASRLDQHEDICQCLAGGQQVTVPICASGVKPPAESAAYERARLAAVQKGSLVGKSWQGRPICVAPSGVAHPG